MIDLTCLIVAITLLEITLQKQHNKLVANLNVLFDHYIIDGMVSVLVNVNCMSVSSVVTRR